MAAEGIIFNIQSFSVQDGPGIRTTVFFKGCNLRCAWCHNPESWKFEPQIQFYPEKCIGCGNCFSVCPNGVHVAAEEHILRRENCTACGRCADECYAGALALTGRRMTAEELFRRIQVDQPYYQKSGGGVTFSGGECMMQPDFLAELLHLCREAGIQTAVDTAGHCPWEKLERMLSDADLFLYDLKAYSPALHKKLTGVENGQILSNFEKLLEYGARVIVRIPCIPGANWEEIPQLADYLTGKPVELVELLAYHKLGEGKRKALDMAIESFTVPSKADMQEMTDLFESKGIPVRCSGV